MRKLGIEVGEAASHPEGGYAVLVLRGLETFPDGATFRLKPVDARGVHEPVPGEAWPAGEHRPLAVRRTDAGIELLIGPDIVESPALVPGTLGVVEVPAAGVRGEFLWPSIRPSARPRRRHLSIVRPSAGRGAGTPAAAAAQAGAPPPLPAAAATPRAAAAASSETGPLATLSAMRFSREAAAHADPAVVPVTALDHEVPAVASIEEAIGTKIVSIEAARDRAHPAEPPVVADGERTAAPPAGLVASGEAPRAAGRIAAMPIGRKTAVAACIAFVVSGGVLLAGRHRVAVDEPSPTPARASVAQAAGSPPSGAQAQGDRGPAAAAALSPAAVEAPAQPHDTRDAEASRMAAAPVPSSRGQSQDGSPAPTAGSADATSAAPAFPAREPSQPPAAAPPPVQEVTLRMRGGGFEVAGELKGFDGTRYVIESRTAGVLTMDASRFECIGEPCGRAPAAILPLSERPSPVKPDTLRIEGAPALAAEFVPQLVKDYAASIGATVSGPERETSGTVRYRIADPRGAELATVEVVPAGASQAQAAVERGAAAFALLDQPLASEVAPRSPLAVPPRPRRAVPHTPRQPQPATITVGLDGIAVVGSTTDAPPSIPLELLARVLAGQITDWYDLGRAPGAIQLYLPPDGSGTLDTLVRHVLRPRGLELSRTARRMSDEAEAAEAAARDPHGLAVVPFATRHAARPISLEMACGLVVRPTSFAVKTGEYPLIRRLSLHMPAHIPQPSARGLARLAQSVEVHAAVAAARIVDGSIASLPIEEQSERLAWAANAPAPSFDMAEMRQMLADLQGATRLSVTFRFLPGTNDLDAQSRRDVARLADALKEPELAGRRLLLAGFTDTGGKFQANMAVAAKRASQVRTALVAAAGTGLDQRLLSAKGYGPLAPVACNGTSEGGRLNRRVEVWVLGDAAGRAAAR